jgi:hypothetical protein
MEWKGLEVHQKLDALQPRFQLETIIKQQILHTI